MFYISRSTPFESVTVDLEKGGWVRTLPLFDSEIRTEKLEVELRSLFLVNVSSLLRTDEHVPLLLLFSFESDLSSSLVQFRIRSFFFSSLSNFFLWSPCGLNCRKETKIRWWWFSKESLRISEIRNDFVNLLLDLICLWRNWHEFVKNWTWFEFKKFG